MKRVTSLKRSSLSLVICIQNASNTSQRTFLIQVFFNRVRFSFLFYLHFPPDFLILKIINFGIYLFFFAMQIPFKSWYKRLIHLLNVAKVRFIRKLDLVDSIPAAIRIPLWVLLLILGVIGLYIPLINGMILMIIGARMIGKKTFIKVYIWLINTFSKKYKNLKSAFFHTLKD